MEAWLQGIFADTPVLTVPWSIDYFSVIAGVLTGALFACDRKLDIIGTVVCGLITGYGGGVLDTELVSALQRTGSRLREMRSEWERPPHKPVAQQSMGSGTVELF